MNPTTNAAHTPNDAAVRAECDAIQTVLDSRPTITKLLAERDALRADIAQLQLELTHYRYEHESLDQQRDCIREERDDAIARNLALRAECAKLKEDRDRLADACEEAWAFGSSPTTMAKIHDALRSVGR